MRLISRSHTRYAPDRKGLTIELRDGVRFQDGAALTASDVKRSIERALDPRSASGGADLYATLVGFEAFRSGDAPHLEGIEVTSERTLVLRLARPSATFLPLLTLGFASPVCPSTSAIANPRAPDPPCGAGPFRVERFDPEDRLRLVRVDEASPDEAELVDAIDWQFHVPSTAQRYRFERGGARLDP